MATTRRRPGAAGVIALLCAAAMAGCSAPTAVTAVTTPAGITVSPTRPTAGPSSAVSLPAPAPLPAGHSWITSAAHGVKFAVPAGWGMFDLSTFADPTVRAALAPVAAKLGLSVDDYVRQLTQQNDAIVTGPDRGGFSPTISVRKEAAQVSSYVPSVADVQALVDKIGGAVTAVDPLTTPVGAGYAARYTRASDSNPAVTLHCASLGLPSVKNTMFLVTVESDSAADRDALVGLVTATLQRA